MFAQKAFLFSSSFLLFYATSPALHTWPSASRAKSLTSDIAEAKETREVTSLILHRTGSSGRNIHGPVRIHLWFRDLSLLEASLWEQSLAPVLLPTLNSVSSNRLLQQQLSCLLSTWHWVPHCSTMRHLVTDKHQLCPCPLLEGAGDEGLCLGRVAIWLL